MPSTASPTATRLPSADRNADGTALIATVREFWIDGYVGYKGTVVVDYALKDEDGRTLWTKTGRPCGRRRSKGSDGGSDVARSAYSMAEEIVRKSLASLSEDATKEFQSADFQEAAK